MKPLSIAVDTAWRLAVWEASAKNSEFIEKEHAVIGLLGLEKVATGKPDDMKLNRDQWNCVRAEWAALSDVFAACSLDATTLRRDLRKRIEKGSHQHTENVIHRSPECKAFFQIAAALAGEAESISSLHLLSAIVGEPGYMLGLLLKDYSVTPADLKAQLLERAVQGFKVPVEVGPQKDHPKSFLEKFGKDLTRSAQDGKLGPFVGRREELLQVIQTLARNTKNNPVLAGEPGVGKTAVVEALAVRLADGKVPEFLQGSRIIELNMGVLVAGTSYRIGATTSSEYRRHIETDAALERSFEKVIVEEPARDECIEMLKGIRGKLEQHHACTIDDSAIQSAVELSIRFDSDHRLPDKAIDLLDRAGAKLQAPRLTMIGQNSTVGTINAESISAHRTNRQSLTISRN